MKTNFFVAFALTALCCGCNHTSPPPPPQPAVPVANSKAPEERKIPGKKSKSPAQFAAPRISATREIGSKLRIVFTKPSVEKDFTSKLAQRLAEVIIPDNAEIRLKDKGDVQISLLPEFELLDKTSQHFRISCNEIVLKITSRDKVYAIKTITPKSLPRQAGVQKAKNQYLVPAVKEFSSFLTDSLKRISKELIAVSVVDFKLAPEQGKYPEHLIAGQVDKIIQTLKATPGVIDYTLIRQDPVKRTCAFRVVFLKKVIPHGIVNTINLKLAGK